MTSQQPVFFDRISLRGPDNREYDRIPAFRVLDGEGKVLNDVQGDWLKLLEDIPHETLVKMYETMLRLPVLVSPVLFLRAARRVMWG